MGLNAGMRGKGRALVCAAFALVAVASLFGPAAGASAANWTKVTSMGEIGNLGEIGLERTADGVLHVLWPREGGPSEHQVLHSAISANGKNVAGPDLVFSNSSELGAVNASVDLLAGPAGGLRAVFSGIFPDEPYDSVVTTETSSASGTAWSAPAAVSNTVGALTVYAASGISAALTGSGELLSVWGSPGAGAHYGLDPAAADVPIASSCCVYNPNVGVDSVTGAAVIAQAGPGEGLQVSGSVPVQQVPGSGLPAAVESQRVGITGRIGAAGVYVAYLRGAAGKEKPALWQVGAARSKVIRAPAGAAQEVTLAPGPGGRLWIAWEEGGGTIALTRTNPAATRFGQIVRVKPPDGTFAIYRLNMEGSRRFLDLFALIENDGVEYWHRRLRAGLTLKAMPRRVRRGHRVVFRVLDAGAPVGGARVVLKLGSHRRTGTTRANGRVGIVVPAGTRPKRYPATAKKAGYAKARIKVRVKR
jgi:hypothetical protein